jgi:hypothetical protein
MNGDRGSRGMGDGDDAYRRDVSDLMTCQTYRSAGACSADPMCVPDARMGCISQRVNQLANQAGPAPPMPMQPDL